MGEGALWPLAQGNSWRYIDGQARRVDIVIVRTGPKSVVIDGKKHSVTGYIAGTIMNGTAVREDTYFELGGSLYKMAASQLLNRVRTDFEPPIKIADPLQPVGATWKHEGKATVTAIGTGAKTAFLVKAEYRAAAIGSQRLGGGTFETRQFAGEITFYNVDGAAVLGGEETYQFIESVGPGRISQSGGFEELSLVLQDYSLK